MSAVSRVTAARQLALAASTAEVLDAMARAGIRTVMLKGTAIATRLYEQPSARLAGDVDLLVEPRQARKAGEVLQRIGFRDVLLGARVSERTAHAVTFHRDGASPATVDLHTAVPWCIRDPESLWVEFTRATTIIRIADQPVEVLDDPAQALVIAAHAVQHGGAVKPREDLRRALAHYDGDTWAKAAAIARRLDAEAFLAAGLRFEDAGGRLADQLGLEPNSDSIEIRLRLAGAPPVAMGVMRFAQAGSVRQRVRLIVSELFPTRSWMRFAYPFADRGPAALTLAYVYRPFSLIGRLPRAIRAWRRASRSR